MTSKDTEKYFCSHDCERSGCPGHVAEIHYQSAVDVGRINDGNGGEISFCLSSLGAILTLIERLGNRRSEVTKIEIKTENE